MTAIQVLSEIGGDMSVFPTAKNLVSWARCCPRNDQSNHKIKSTRISRAGSYFKPVLVQVANALIKSKKNPEFATRYRRIKARRGHKKAIIAICRMILTAIWHILSDLKPYTPEGFLAPPSVNESKVLTTSLFQTSTFLEYYGAAEPTNGATPFCLLSYFAIAGSSPYTSLIERSLDGSTLSISIL